jgi:hypothetical protein
LCSRASKTLRRESCRVTREETAELLMATWLVH